MKEKKKQERERRKQEKEKNNNYFGKKQELNYDLLRSILGKEVKTWELVEKYDFKNEDENWNRMFRDTKEDLQKLKNKLKEEE